MLFRRREAPRAFDAVRRWVWPRKSWRRTVLYYVKRILRLSGSPHAIALGAAVGVATSFTPLIGFHLILTFVVAWLLRANMIAGAIGTVVGNPLTFPFIWASTYELGSRILDGVGRETSLRLADELTTKSFLQIMPLIVPMAVGSLVLGLATGVLTYGVLYKAVSAYQEARRQRLARRNGAAPRGAIAP
jgi:uncharacterized protein (DUF2062 family)